MSWSAVSTTKRVLAAVKNGIAAAERGEFIEEEEMDSRIERMFLDPNSLDTAPLPSCSMIDNEHGRKSR